MIRLDLEQFRHFWLPLVIVGGLVVLTAWLGQVSDHPVAASTAKPGHYTDYFVDDLHAVAYDPQGVPRYHLVATRLLHYMDDDTTTLEAPRFLRDGPGVPKIEASSERGTVSPQGEVVTLLGNVRMRQDSLAGSLPVEMRTQLLRIMVKEDRLATDRAVVVTQGASRMEGGAMKADGKARTFEMDGHVRGVYESRS